VSWWQKKCHKDAELMTQLIIAEEIGYLDKEVKDQLFDDCDKISAMLTKLIRARKPNS